MPRSYQAYPHNAVVTHSPASVGGGDTSGALNGGKNAFKIPSMFDVCAPVTQGTKNPFVSGLNTMGDGQNHTGVAGQTGNMLSGLQQFLDALCGFALGGTTTHEVLQAARELRRQGGDLHETLEAVRRLRATVGAGTTPQTVLTGVEAVTGLVNTNPLAQSAIATGQAAVGVSGNQIIDSINGSQTMANQGHQLLTGQTTSGASGTDLLNASGAAINQNTSNHTGHQSLTTAQSVNLVNQNLLVSQDFSSAYTVVGDTHWSWDGTDGSPSTNVLGCAKVTCNGSQAPLVSSEIPVVAGETIEVACELKWSGLTYTGVSPLVLRVEKYRLMKDPAGSGQNVYTDIGWYDVFTVPSPATSSDWTGIAGSYTVQPGVDQLRFRLEVAPNAHGGVVKWDAAEFLKLDLIAADCVPGATGVDTVVTNLYGSQGSGFTQNDAAVAFANTASSLASVSAKTAALQAEGSTGSIAGDDFSWTGEIIASPNWGGSYAISTGDAYQSSFGSLQANGTDAVWVNGSGAPLHGGVRTTFVGAFDWEGTHATSITDYQLIQLVLDSPSDFATFTWGETRLYGRIASDWSSYVYLLIGGDGNYYVRCYASGAVTTLDSGTCSVPGAGATVSFYLGDKTSTAPRHFRSDINGTTISSFTESGTTSVYGSSNRKWGFGVGADVTFGAFENPSAINQWLAQDQ